MAYNINAARALRQEATGVGWDVEIDGLTFQLPYEVPQEFANRMEELQGAPGTVGIRTLLEIALGEQAAEFPFDALSTQDIAALFEAYMNEVEVGLGELRRSSSSSTSTPAPSKPTSKPRTASASRRSTKAR